MCVKKQRWLDRDLKHVKVAFFVYQRFFATHYGKMKPTYEKFMNSKMYLQFVKFARYLHDINALKPELFMDFLFKGGVKIDDWTKPYVYEVYLRELNKTESATDALERNLLLMEQWARENNEVWTDFFRKIQPTIAVLWIRSGRISPWVLYSAPSAQKLIERMSEEQIKLIDGAIEPSFWEKRIMENRSEAAAITEELRACGL